MSKLRFFTSTDKDKINCINPPHRFMFQHTRNQKIDGVNGFFFDLSSYIDFKFTSLTGTCVSIFVKIHQKAREAVILDIL